MATAKSQRKWRNKNRFVKTQLNVMARRLVHDDLDDIAEHFDHLESATRRLLAKEPDLRRLRKPGQAFPIFEQRLVGSPAEHKAVASEVKRRIYDIIPVENSLGLVQLVEPGGRAGNAGRQRSRRGMRRCSRTPCSS